MEYQIIRLKGRFWLPGKSLPLQIQMVGPRLSSWFEAAPMSAWRPKESGIDIVLICFKHDALKAIRERLLASFSN